MICFKECNFISSPFSEVEKKGDKYGRYLKPWTFSTTELPSLYMSIAAVPFTLLLCGLCLWDLGRPQLLYSAVPTCFQNGVVFALLFILETIFLHFGVTVTCYPMILQNLVLQKVDLECKLLKQMLK